MGADDGVGATGGHAARGGHAWPRGRLCGGGSNRAERPGAGYDVAEGRHHAAEHGACARGVATDFFAAAALFSWSMLGPSFYVHHHVEWFGTCVNRTACTIRFVLPRFRIVPLVQTQKKRFLICQHRNFDTGKEAHVPNVVLTPSTLFHFAIIPLPTTDNPTALARDRLATFDTNTHRPQFCKLRGPWLAPPGYVRESRPLPAAVASQETTETNPNSDVPPASSGDNSNRASEAVGEQGSPRSSANGEGEAGRGSVTGGGSGSSNNSSPTNAASGSVGSASDAAAAAAAAAAADEGAVKPGKRQIKLRLLPPSQALQGGRGKETVDDPERPQEDRNSGGKEGGASEEVTDATVEDAPRGGVSPSSVASGKEAAMAQLAEAQGGEAEAKAGKNGEDAAGGERSVPMDVSAPDASSAGSGSGSGDDGDNKAAGVGEAD